MLGCRGGLFSRRESALANCGVRQRFFFFGGSSDVPKCVRRVPSRCCERAPFVAAPCAVSVCAAPLVGPGACAVDVRAIEVRFCFLTLSYCVDLI